MPLVQDMRHPKGMDFNMQRKVVMLRDDKKMSWDDIADPLTGGITNLAGGDTSRGVVRIQHSGALPTRDLCQMTAPQKCTSPGQ